MNSLEVICHNKFFDFYELFFQFVLLEIFK